MANYYVTDYQGLITAINAANASSNVNDSIYFQNDIILTPQQSIDLQNVPDNSGTLRFRGGTPANYPNQGDAANPINYKLVVTTDISIKDSSPTTVQPSFTIGPLTLQIGDGGTSGSLSGNLRGDDDGVLAFNRSVDTTYTGTFSLEEENTIRNDVAGTTVTFTGANGNPTGVAIRASQNTGAASDYELEIDGDGDGVISGAITDGGVTTAPGSITKEGEGTWAFAGNNTYIGVTTVAEGVLVVQSDTGLGSVSGETVVEDGGTLALEAIGADLAIGAEALSIAGEGEDTAEDAAEDSGALVNLTGNNSYAGAITLTAAATITSSAGTLTLTGGLNAGTDAVDAVLTLAGDGDGTVDTAGIGEAVAGLIKEGEGTWTLAALNSYTGETTINGGTLALSGEGSITSSSKVINEANFDISGSTDGASIMSLAGTSDDATVTLGENTLTITNADDAFAGAITGSGGLSVDGGTEILTGESDYTGTTAISAGATLQFGAGESAGTISAESAVANDGTLAFDHTDTLTFSNNVTGDGDLTHTGGGTTILTGENTYVGNTTINGGTLQLGDGGQVGTLDAASAIIINVDGTLAVDHGGPITLSNVISGAGALRQIGDGTLTLSNINTSYSGSVELERGTLELANIQAAGTGDISFETGAQTLRLDTAGTLANEIVDFGVGDTIDLDAITFRNAQLTVSGSTVTVMERGINGGNDVNTLTFDDVPDGFQFILVNDGNSAALQLRAIPTGGGGGTTPMQPTEPTTPTEPTQPTGPSAEALAQFGTVVTTPNSPAGAIYGLYEALLNRAPDALGLETFTTALQNGASLTDVANALLNSPERGMGVTDPTAFVQSLYQNLLNRPADASGLATFTNELANGVSPATVAVQLATSAEAQGVLAPTFTNGVFVPDASESSVARLYYGLLDRAPDQGGLQALSAFIETGGGGAAGEAGRLFQVVSSILSSPEYTQQHAGQTDAAFVTELYQDALGRAPDAAGQAAALSALTNGASRAQIAFDITQSPEAQIHLVGQIEQGAMLMA